MVEPIVFYDIPRRVVAPEDNEAWSPNTWKTRYSLNIKGLPYKTVWVEYPDIEALYQKIGAVPTNKKNDGSPYYTLPVIHDPNTDTTVVDSGAIVRYLDKTYPETFTLIPRETDALHAAFEAGFNATLWGSGDFRKFIVQTMHDALNEVAQPFIRQTREPELGEKIEDVSPLGSEKRAKHWDGSRKAWHMIAEWSKTSGEDRLFFMGGDRICYADVTIASFLIWIRIFFGEGSKEWQDVLAWDGGRWKRLMDAFKEYEIVDAGSKVVL